MGDEVTGQLHEVVLDDADDVKPVGDDSGLGKVTADEAAVGAGKIDADDFHVLATLEFTEETGEIGLV